MKIFNLLLICSLVCLVASTSTFLAQQNTGSQTQTTQPASNQPKPLKSMMKASANRRADKPKATAKQIADSEKPKPIADAAKAF
jgi:hypothetical protein